MGGRDSERFCRLDKFVPIACVYIFDDLVISLLLVLSCLSGNSDGWAKQKSLIRRMA